VPAFPRVPQFWRYVLLVITAFLLSAGGIIWATHTRRALDAGCGGAVATAIAFVALFVRPDYGLQIYKERAKRIPDSASPIDRLSAQVDALVAALHINSDGQKKQNRAIAIASVIGTMAWGFGSYVAAWLQKNYPWI